MKCLYTQAHTKHEKELDCKKKCRAMMIILTEQNYKIIKGVRRRGKGADEAQHNITTEHSRAKNIYE